MSIDGTHDDDDDDDDDGDESDDIADAFRGVSIILIGVKFLSTFYSMKTCEWAPV